MTFKVDSLRAETTIHEGVNRVYSAANKPTSSDVGLGNVPNTVHTTEATANTVAVRDSSGDLKVRLIRSNYTNQTTLSGALAFRTNNTSDDYIRFCSDTAAIRTWLGVLPSSGKAVDSDKLDGKHANEFANNQGRVVTDYNAQRVSGMYGVDSVGTNGPSNNGYGSLIVATNSDTGLQIAGGHNNDKLAFRGWTGSGGIWTAWRNVYHEGFKPTAADVGLSNYKNTSSSSHASVEITGEKGGYSGIYFPQFKQTLMINGTVSGVYKADSSSWQWYFTNDTLTSGKIPWARIPDAPATATRWPTAAEAGAHEVKPWISNPGMDANDSGNYTAFTYAKNAAHSGPLVSMGVNHYTMQFNSKYFGNQDLAFRTNNGDSNTWNPWVTVYTSSNKPTPAEIGAQPAGSYAAASHTHTIANITSLQASLDAKQGIDTQKGAIVAARYLTGGISAVGTKIRLPFLTNAAKMVCFTVRVYQDYNTTDVLFSGYLYGGTNQWHDPKAIVSVGSSGLNVKMGRDADGRAYVWLQGGDYRGVAVLDVVGGYNTADWNTGWEISESDTVPNLALDTTIYPPYSPNNKPTPADIGAQPAGSYAASSHTHDWSQVTGQPVTATRWPTFAEVTGKPTTFAPSSHTHPVSQVTGLGNAATKNVGTAVGDLLEANSSYFGVQSSSDFPDGTLIRTSLPATATGPSITLKLWGKGYGGLPHLIMVEAYQYEGSWYSTSGINLSGNITNVTIMEFGGYVCFWFATTGYWGSFFVEAYDTRGGGIPANMVTSVVNSAKPAGTKVVDIPLTVTYNTSNIPATATRWPTPAEVGLGNVVNKGWNYGAIGDTYAVRNVNGDLVARQFHGDGSNLLNLRWAQLVGAPVTALRWPNWNEVSGKPAAVSDWINLFNGGISGRTNRLPIPPQMLNHLKAGKVVELRVWVNRSGAIAGDRRCIQHFIDGTDGWVNYVNDKVGIDFTWYGVSYVYVANASTGHGSNANCIYSQYQNMTKIDMKLL